MTYLTVVAMTLYGAFVAAYAWYIKKQQTIAIEKARLKARIEAEIVSIETDTLEAQQTKEDAYERTQAEVDMRLREPIDTDVIIDFSSHVLSEIRQRRK